MGSALTALSIDNVFDADAQCSFLLSADNLLRCIISLNLNQSLKVAIMANLPVVKVTRTAIPGALHADILAYLQDLAIAGSVGAASLVTKINNHQGSDSGISQCDLDTKADNLGTRTINGALPNNRNATDISTDTNRTTLIRQGALDLIDQYIDDRYGSLKAYFIDSYANEGENWWFALGFLLDDFHKACQEDIPANRPSHQRAAQLQTFLNEAMFLRFSIADATLNNGGTGGSQAQGLKITMTDLSRAHRMINEAPLSLGSRKHPMQDSDFAVGGDGWFAGRGKWWSPEKLVATGWLRNG